MEEAIREILIYVSRQDGREKQKTNVRIVASVEQYSWSWKLNSGFNYNRLIDYAKETDVGSMRILFVLILNIEVERAVGQLMLFFR